MRSLSSGFFACVLGLAVAACGPKVQTGPSTFDEDFGAKPAANGPVAAAAPVERPLAPVGKGARSGTIERAKLLAVLDSGPAGFLRQVEISARMDGERFVGWQLVQVLDHDGPLVGIDVVPGDVLLAINGKPLSRPDQLQSIWDSLRTANTLVAELWRGDAKLKLEFAIQPAVQTAALEPAASSARAASPSPAASDPPMTSQPASQSKTHRTTQLTK